jgi:hypothetical protein
LEDFFNSLLERAARAISPDDVRHFVPVKSVPASKTKLGWATEATGGANGDAPYIPICERAERIQYRGEYPINNTLLVYIGEELREGDKQVVQRPSNRPWSLATKRLLCVDD